MKRSRWLVPLAWAATSLPSQAVDPTQQLYRTVERGNRAYDAGDYEAAQRAYDDAAQQAPDDPRLAYNQGTAALQRGDAAAARSALDRALAGGDPTLRRDSWYNHGVNSMLRQEWGPAVRAFGEALRLDPRDAEARRNLELAVRQLQRTPPPQQQPQGGGQQQQSGASGAPPPAQQQPQASPPEAPPSGQGGAPPQGPQDQPTAGQQPRPGQSPKNQNGPAEGGSDQGTAPDRSASQRLLDQLKRGEQEALKRQLGRQNKGKRRGADRSREKDW